MRHRMAAIAAVLLWGSWRLATGAATELCPTAKTGDTVASCKQLVCGLPKTPQDQTRTQIGAQQLWEPWSTIPPTGAITSCIAGKGITWTTKAALALPEPAVSNPVPKPPPATVSTTATSSTLTIQWTAPIAYTDGSSIAAGTSVTYNVYGGIQGAIKMVVAPAVSGLSNVQTVTPGNWCYQVTAIVASVESASSPESCATVGVSSSPVPNAPGKPTVSPVTTGTAVYMELQVPDGFSFLQVGTVPLGTPCDPTQRVNDYLVVPASAVTWTGKIHRLAALAICSSP